MTGCPKKNIISKRVEGCDSRILLIILTPIAINDAAMKI